MYEVSNQFKEYCKRHQRSFKNCTITYEEDGTTIVLITHDISIAKQAKRIVRIKFDTICRLSDYRTSTIKENAH